MKINTNYLKLKDSYLFSTIAKKVNEYKAANPSAEILRMGIGDVTLPLCEKVVDALKDASMQMGVKQTFHGYGPEQGYDFLREKIREYYAKRGVVLNLNEIFISDGAKSDVGNIIDIFDRDNSVLVTDPVYPVYVDTNIMEGREIKYIDATKNNNFSPLPDKNIKADLIYLCSPNNPTGAAYNNEQLKTWVDYALENNAVILFDAAYEAFIEEDLPHSIFEIEGARKCAIEFNSLSKTAGFTGTRCGYTVIPDDLVSGGVKLNSLWNRRQTTKFNGVSYIVQKGAEAVFSEEGQKQVRENIKYYKDNAKIIAQTLDELKVWYTGGTNSPYIFMSVPDKMTSWEFFDYLLKEANVVGTPGSGFGKNGEGFFRLTAFASREATMQAMIRIKKLYRG